MVPGVLCLWVPVLVALHRRTAAAFRCLYDPRLCRRPIRLPALPQDRCRVRPFHRILLHDAPNERGRHDPRLRLPRGRFSRNIPRAPGSSRCRRICPEGVSLLGRGRGGRGRDHLERGPRGHEGHHPRAGLPILGQDVRYLGARVCPNGSPGALRPASPGQPASAPSYPERFSGGSTQHRGGDRFETSSAVCQSSGRLQLAQSLRPSDQQGRQGRQTRS